MKIFNKYFVGALLLGTTIGLTSCDLDEYNPSSETADAVFATEQGMQGLVNQMYYNFRWKYFGREDPVLYFEGAGDIWANIPDKYTYGMQLTRFVDLQGDRGQVQGAWNRVYDNVNLANEVLEYLPTTQGLKQETHDTFEGEARFMRSYNYWWLVEWFGDIEMRTKPTSTPVYTAYRTDRKVIYDEVIIPDAEAATKLLPIQPYNGEVGRSTKKAAYALLARVCLTRAQYETAGSSEARAFYQKAYDAAKYVMDNQASLGISLYSTYDEIWQAKNNKTNSEYLWVVTHSSNSTLNKQSGNPNRLHMYFSPRLLNRFGNVQNATNWEYPRESVLLCPTYYLLNLYADWDLRYDVLFQEEFPVSADSYTWDEAAVTNYMAPAALQGKTIKKGDLGLKVTRKTVTDAEREAAAQQGYVLLGANNVYDLRAGKVTSMGGARIRDLNPDDIGGVPTTTFVATSYPRFRKYRIWDRDPNGTFLLTAANAQVGFADVPIFRYAEMPLIAAECQMQMGNTAEAANIINDETKGIRTSRILKAGHNASEMKVSASDMTIEWFLEERARELCGEWLRWFDLKRTHKMVEYFKGHNPAMRGDEPVDEHNYLWPIPTSFLDKLENATEFGQNPGYNPYVK